VTALRNILDNALRYGDAEAIVVLRIVQRGGMAGYTVEDQGSGMSDAEIGRAGQRFWRKGGGQGSGLGLSIVKAIVARYDGSWKLERRDGGGLVAHLAFPAEQNP
jgi:signal transduction histidine kinase